MTDWYILTDLITSIGADRVLVLLALLCLYRGLGLVKLGRDDEKKSSQTRASLSERER